jgi:hypothetical protein
MRPQRFALLSLVALLATACASTQLVSTWKDPGTSQVYFRNVIAVAPVKDPAMRRAMEDELAREIKNTHAVPSYTVLSEEELSDPEKLKEKVQALGFDGMVVFRIVSVDKEATWVPGTYAGPYWAFGGWPAYDYGYVQTDTVVRVDTNVYSVPDNKLVWASASKTFNPGSAQKLVDSVAKAVAKEMKKEGLVT